MDSNIPIYYSDVMAKMSSVSAVSNQTNRQAQLRSSSPSYRHTASNTNESNLKNTSLNQSYRSVSTNNRKTHVPALEGRETKLPFQNIRSKQKDKTVYDVDTIEKLRIERAHNAAKWLKLEKERQSKPIYELRHRPREISKQQMEIDRQAVRSQNNSLNISSSSLLTGRSLKHGDVNSISSSSHANITGRNLNNSSMISAGIATVSSFIGNHNEISDENTSNSYFGKENTRRFSNIDRDVPKLSHVDTKSLLRKALANIDANAVNTTIDSIPSPGVTITKRKPLDEHNADSDSEDGSFFYSNPTASKLVQESQPASGISKPSELDVPNENADDDYDDDFETSVPRHQSAPTTKFVSLKRIPDEDNSDSETDNSGSDAISAKNKQEGELRRIAAREYLSKQRQKYKQDRALEQAKILEEKLKLKIKLADLDKKRRMKIIHKADLKSASDIVRPNIQADLSYLSHQTRNSRSSDPLHRKSSESSVANSRNEENKDDTRADLSRSSIGNVILASPPRVTGLSSIRYSGIVDDVLGEFRRSKDRPNLSTNASIEVPRALGELPNPETLPEPMTRVSKQTTTAIDELIKDITRHESNSQADSLPYKSKSIVEKSSAKLSNIVPEYNIKQTRVDAKVVKVSRKSTSPSHFKKSTFSSSNQALGRSTSTPRHRNTDFSQKSTYKDISQKPRANSSVKSKEQSKYATETAQKSRSKSPALQEPSFKDLHLKNKSNNLSKVKKSRQNKNQNKRTDSSIDMINGDLTDLLLHHRYPDDLIDTVHSVDNPMVVRRSSARDIRPEIKNLQAVSANVKNVTDVLAEVDRLSAMLRDLTKDLENQVSMVASVKDSAEYETIASASGLIGLPSVESKLTTRSIRQSLADKIDAILASVHNNSQENDESNESIDPLPLKNQHEEGLPSRHLNRSYEDSDAVLMEDSEDENANKLDKITAENMQKSNLSLKATDITKDPLLKQQLGALQDHRDILNRFNSDEAVDNVINSVSIKKPEQNLNFTYDEGPTKSVHSDNRLEPGPPGGILFYSKPPRDPSATMSSISKSNAGIADKTIPINTTDDFALRNIGSLGGTLNSRRILNNERGSDMWKQLDEEKDIDWSDEDADDSSADLRMVSIFAKHIIDQREKLEESKQDELRRQEMESRLAAAKLHVAEQQLQAQTTENLRDSNKTVESDAPPANISMVKESIEKKPEYNFWGNLIRREELQSDQEVRGSASSLQPSSNETVHIDHFASTSTKRRLSPAEIRLRVIDELRKQEILIQAAQELSDLEKAHTARVAAELVHQLQTKSGREMDEFKQRQELLLQQQSYEISLAAVVSSTQQQYQEDIFIRDMNIEQLNNAIANEQIRSKYEGMMSQAVTASRNLEQAAELLALENALKLPQYPTKSTEPVYPSTSKHHQQGSTISSVRSKDSFRSSKSSYGKSAATKAAAALDNSSVLFDDIEEEPGIHEEQPPSAVVSSVEESYSMSFDEDRSKLSGKLRRRGKPESIASISSSGIVSSRKTSSVNYSDTFDEVTEDPIEPHPPNIPSPSRPKLSTSRYTVHHKSASSTEEVYDDDYELSKEEDDSSPNNAFGGKMTFRDMKPRSIVSKSVPADESVVSYRHDLDEVVASYRKDLDLRLKSYEKTYDIKLSLISTRLQKRLDWLKTNDAAVAVGSVDELRQEEQRAREEFAGAKAKLERDRWAMYARAYKDLKQVKLMKRRADMKQQQVIEGKANLSRASMYEYSDNSSSDDDIMDFRSNKYRKNKRERSIAPKPHSKPKIEVSRFDSDETIEDTTSPRDVYESEEDSEDYEQDYEIEESDEHKASKSQSTSNMYVMSQSSNDRYSQSFSPQRSLEHRKLEVSESNVYSMDFEGTIDASLKQLKKTEIPIKENDVLSPMEDSMDNSIELDPIIAELDSSMDKRRMHINDVKNKIEKLREERNKLQHLQHVHEKLKAKQSERASLISLESDLLKQLEEETLQLQREKEELLRATSLLPTTNQIISNIIEKVNDPTKPTEFENRELMKKWKEELQAAAIESKELLDGADDFEDSFESAADEVEADYLQSPVVKLPTANMTKPKGSEIISESNMLVLRARQIRAATLLQSIVRMFCIRKKYLRDRKNKRGPSSWHLGSSNVDEYNATTHAENNIADDSFGSSYDFESDEELQVMKRTVEIQESLKNMAAHIHLRDKYIGDNNIITESNEKQVLKKKRELVSVDSQSVSDESISESYSESSYSSSSGSHSYTSASKKSESNEYTQELSVATEAQSIPKEATHIISSASKHAENENEEKSAQSSYSESYKTQSSTKQSDPESNEYSDSFLESASDLPKNVDEAKFDKRPDSSSEVASDVDEVDDDSDINYYDSSHSKDLDGENDNVRLDDGDDEDDGHHTVISHASSKKITSLKESASLSENSYDFSDKSEALSPPTSDSSHDDARLDSQLSPHEKSASLPSSPVPQPTVINISDDFYVTEISVDDSANLADISTLSAEVPSEDRSPESSPPREKSVYEDTTILEREEDLHEAHSDSDYDTVVWELHRPVVTSQPVADAPVDSVEDSIGKSLKEVQGDEPLFQVISSVEDGVKFQSDESKIESELALSTAAVGSEENLPVDLPAKVTIENVSEEGIEDSNTADEITNIIINRLVGVVVNDFLYAQYDHFSIESESPLITPYSSPSSSPRDTLGSSDNAIVPPVRLGQESSLLGIIPSLKMNRSPSHSNLGDLTNEAKSFDPNIAMPNSPPHTVASAIDKDFNNELDALYDFDHTSTSQSKSHLPEVDLSTPPASEPQKVTSPAHKSVAVLMAECTQAIMEGSNFVDAIDRLSDPTFKGRFIGNELSTYDRIEAAEKDWKSSKVRSTISVLQDRVHEIISDLHAVLSGVRSIEPSSHSSVLSQQLLAQYLTDPSTPSAVRAARLESHISHILAEESKAAVKLLHAGGLPSELVRVDPTAQVEEEFGTLMDQAASDITDFILQRITRESIDTMIIAHAANDLYIA